MQAKHNANKFQDSSPVLGVAVGETRYLIPMSEVSEVVDMSKVIAIPLTQSWFLGLANVRGNLYGITDLSAYLGDGAVLLNSKSRILLASLDKKLSGGFVVDSMLGIRERSEFTLLEKEKKKAKETIRKQYKDIEERIWEELSLFALMREEKFLQIAL
ncbi:CheW protein [Nitrosomonas sp. PY1]|uniref:chemotaxis protein CheW n=1 Tax=Nitrosomonas sp. PY1 TaxID=1803906 RepID=UPI001FC82590|nr:chemotaxis protein CheW [Nitrosomonas sp. PY1]GKS70232.1 CheW protein [Nitrosomonas sp. PY1]